MRATCRCAGFSWFGVWGFVSCAIAFHPRFSQRADAQLIVLEDAEMARNGRCGLSVTAGQQSSFWLQYRIHPLFLNQVGRV